MERRLPISRKKSKKHAASHLLGKGEEKGVSSSFKDNRQVAAQDGLLHAALRHSPLQLAARRLQEGMSGISRLSETGSYPDPADGVMQASPDAYEWADFLIKTAGDFGGNPYQKELLSLQKLVDQLGRREVAALLAKPGDESYSTAESELADKIPSTLEGELAALQAKVFSNPADVDIIHARMQAFHLPVTKNIIKAVKDYNYNSEWISFNPENFTSWIRLATGQGSIRDAQYIIHEAIEIGELLATDGFDPFMTEKAYSELPGGQQEALGEQFGDDGGLYDSSHLVALEYEYRFLARQINKLTGLNLSFRDAAAADPDRREPAEKLLAEDGVTVLDQAPAYRHKQVEMVKLGPLAMQTVQLPGDPMPLSQVVRRIKASPIAGVAAQLKVGPGTSSSSVIQRKLLDLDLALGATPVNLHSEPIQRLEITFKGEKIETKTKTIFELTQMAQALLKVDVNDPNAKLIYQAIETGEHKEEEEANDDLFDDLDDLVGSTGGFDDLLGEEDWDEPEETKVHPSLLHPGEIRNLNRSLPGLEAKGVHYDNLDGALSIASKKGTLAAQVAELVWRVVNGHTFLDGNKRTGSQMLQSMANKNGKKLLIDPQGLLLKVANAKSGYTVEQFALDLTPSFQ